jgi:urease accessory protein
MFACEGWTRRGGVRLSLLGPPCWSLNVNRRTALLSAALALFVAVPALAHPGHDHGGNALVSGFTHPILGLDHLLAMVAVGLLAVRAARREALWLLPASFVGMMLVGGLISLAGWPLPGAEAGISVSVIVIGVAVAALPQVPMPAAAVVLGLFAIAHGHAHVTEMSGESAALYLLGMTLGTAMLHAAGIGAGMAIARLAGTPWLRVAGGAIAACFAVVMIVGQ